MTDDQRLLAHAALDGELSAEELARAEQDPDVVAEIARLGDVRRRVANVDPLSPERRTSLLATALDVFDELGEDRPQVVAPPPASLAARRRARWMMPAAAAALVGVVAVGVVAANRDDDDRGDLASEATSATDAGAERTATEMDATIALADDDEFASSAATMLDAPLVADELPLVRTPAELTAYASMATATMEAPAVETSLAADAPAAVTSTVTVTDTDTDSGGAGAPGVTAPTCAMDGSEYVGTVSYGTDHATAVVIDVLRLDDRITGLEIADCTEVVSALAG